MQLITKQLADISAIMYDGVDFVKIRFFMEDMEKRAQTGDDAAQQLCDIVINFHKLCKYVGKTHD